MSTLRNLQVEWNNLVPTALAQGLRGVRLVPVIGLHPSGRREPIAVRQERLEWLRRELNLTTVLTAPSTDFTFGVELELIMPGMMRHSDLASAIAGEGIPCQAEQYNHSVRSGWKVISDGSLGDYRHGAEVVSPVLSGDDGFAQLRKICQVLTRLGCRVNKRCGMHVHVGARNEAISFFKSLVRLYQQAEPAIDSFLAPSRRGAFGGNGFCKSVRISEGRFEAATTLEEVAQSIGQTVVPAHCRNSGRYCKVNLQSFSQHGTFEFRHHQGTVEADKAENWVRFCLRMALAARNGASPASTIEALLITIGATEQETTYITNRISHFNRLAARRAA